MANVSQFLAGTSRVIAVTGAIACVFIAVPAVADVKAGVDAWSVGDYSTAISEWTGPARNGDADAIFNLAQAYRLGRGVQVDMIRARELYAQAAEKGHLKAADNYGLLLFQQGDKEASIPLITAAAERGDPRAQYVLGLAHFNGDYAQKDWVRAYALLTLSNGAGLPQAGSALAQMDNFVPLEQRQEAQVLARQLEGDAERRRASELASLDLGTAHPTLARSTSVPAQPAPTAVSTITKAAEPVPRTVTPRTVTPQLAQPTRSTPTPIPVPAAAPIPVSASARQQPVQRTGTWRVQLGAFGVAGNADRLWSKLSSNSALSGTSKKLVPAGGVTRLQAIGFDSRGEAQSACATLKKQGQGCIVAGN